MDFTKLSKGIEEKCQYCDRNFKTLSKHIWKCTKKPTQKALSTLSSPEIHNNVRSENNYIENIKQTITNVNNISDNSNIEGIISEYDKEIKSQEKKKR